MARYTLISEQAREEIAQVHGWYESQGAGLGERFLEVLSKALCSISLQPDIHPVRYARFRRMRMRKFPYAIYYEHDDRSISMQSVFHEAQHPSRLDRLKGNDS